MEEGTVEPIGMTDARGSSSTAGGAAQDISSSTPHGYMPPAIGGDIVVRPTTDQDATPGTAAVVGDAGSGSGCTTTLPATEAAAAQAAARLQQTPSPRAVDNLTETAGTVEVRGMHRRAVALRGRVGAGFSRGGTTWSLAVDLKAKVVPAVWLLMRGCSSTGLVNRPRGRGYEFLTRSASAGA